MSHPPSQPVHTHREPDSCPEASGASVMPTVTGQVQGRQVCSWELPSWAAQGSAQKAPRSSPGERGFLGRRWQGRTSNFPKVGV